MEGHIDVAAKLYEFETSALYGGGWIRKKRKAKSLGEEAGREKKLQHILVTHMVTVSQQNAFCMSYYTGSSDIVNDIKILRIITILFSTKNKNDSKNVLFFTVITTAYSLRILQ
jgi:hypothetical protein